MRTLHRSVFAALAGTLLAGIVIAAAPAAKAQYPAQYLLVGTYPRSGYIERYSPSTGVFIDNWVTLGSYICEGLTVGPDNNLYISIYSYGAGQDGVYCYDVTTGTLTNFTGSLHISAPNNSAFGADGNLYVPNGFTHLVNRFNGTTGAYIDDFVPARSGGLHEPTALTFGPDGNLYVLSSGTSQVLRYKSTTGAFIDVFAQDSHFNNVGGQADLGFGPDGNLYATSQNNGNGEIVRFNGQTGAFMDVFASDGMNWGDGGPAPFSWGPDGNLYVAIGQAGGPIERFNGSTGKYLGTFIPNTYLSYNFGMAFWYARQATILHSLTLKPAKLAGGNPCVGTVTLAGQTPPAGATVTLSSNSSMASVPGSTYVSTSTTFAHFPIVTTPQASVQTVKITASWYGGQKSAQLTVRPPVPSSLKLNPSKVTSGSSSSATVTLDGVTAVDTPVTLSSSSTVASVPATVTVPAGQQSATFPVSTTAGVTGIATISASVTLTYSTGPVTTTKSARLTVN